MTKSTLKIIVIILILIIIGAFVGYFYIVDTNEEIDNFQDLKDTYIFGSLVSDDVSSGDISSGGDSVVIGDDNDIGISIEDGDLPKLRKISSSPIAGFISFKNSDDLNIVRYIEKSTGHIYEANTESFTQERISNTTIPKIQEAVWMDDESCIIRYFDDYGNIRSFYAEIKDSEGNSSIDGGVEGVFLEDGMKEIIKLNKQIFYLLDSVAGSVGIISDSDGSDRYKVFESPLKEWLVQQPQKGTLSFTTKPSSSVNGYMYFFNINKEKMVKILGRVRGLTTLTNANKSYTLFSKSYKNGFSLNTYDLFEEISRQLTISTFPEKCIWSGNNVDVYCGVPESLISGDYPDIWYQGLVSFSDSIFRLNTENDDIEKIISPSDIFDVNIDLIKPSLSTDEDYLFFINKKDSSLWSLEL